MGVFFKHIKITFAAKIVATTILSFARGNKKKTRKLAIALPLLISSLLPSVYAQGHALTQDATANGNNSIAAGTSAVADGENSIAIGENSSSNGKDNVVLGAKAKAQNMHADAPDGIFNSVVIGSEAYAGNPARDSESRGSYSVAIGSKAQVQSDYSVTIGGNAAITGGSDYSIVIGGGQDPATRTELQFSPETILIGSGVQVFFGEKGVVLGNKASIEASHNVAIGYASKDRVDTDKGVNFGGNYTPFTGENISYNTASDDANAIVSFGNKQHTRRLINVTAGSQDTDAVNVAQLKTLAENKISFKANDNTNTTKVALGDTQNIDTGHTRLQFGILGQTGSSLSTTTENSNVYLKLDVEKLAGDLEKYQPAVPVAYTNAQGKKLIKHNNKFYDLDSVKGKVFVDGQWYDPQDLNPDGTKKNSANGTTIAEETNVSVNVINSDGTSTNPTAVGNVGSALGLTNMAQTTSANGTKIDLADKSKYDEVRKVIAGDQFNNTGGIYIKTGSELYKAATLGDLQAVAGAGLVFKDGNSSEVHRPLGTELIIKGKNNTNVDTTSYSDQNLATKAENNSISIQMLKSPTFDKVTLNSQVNNNQPNTNLAETDASTIGYVNAKVAAITGGLSQNLNVLNNGSDEKSLALNTAKLDMVNGENTTASVTKDQNNNLKIAFDLNSELKKITSIEGSQTGDAKLTFSTDAVTINYKKLTGLTAGSIATGSQDAVTGGQIYSSLESVKNLLGNSFTLNDGSITAPTNIGKTGKNTIDEAIGSLKDTLDLGYYLNTMNGKSNKMALGSTFEFISATAPFMNNGVGVHYVGRNLATKINNDKVEIGLSDTPTFNKVTLGVDSSNQANNTTPGITMSATPDQGILNFAKDPANAQPADPSADNKVVLTGVKSDKNKPDSVATMADITGLQNGGLKVATGDNQTSTMKLGDTLKIVNGVNTTVSAITTDNGTHSYHIDVTGLPISYVDENNQPLVNVGGKYYAKADVTNGTVNANAQEVQPKSAQIQMPDGTLMSLKVESAIDKDNNLAGKEFTDALEAAAKDDKKKNAVATVKDLSEVNKIANKGWTLKTKADGGTVVNGTVANGEVINPENNTLTLVAGKDITLTQTQGEIKIETNNQAIVNSAVLPTKFVDDQGNQIYATKKPDGTVTYHDKPDGTGNEIAADKVSVGINSQNPLTLSGLKSAVTPDTATPEDFINNLVGSESDKQIKPNAIAADKAATTGDLKNMALAGMTFAAKNEPDTQAKTETPTTVNIGGDVVINGGKNAKVTMSESGGKGNKMVKFTIDVNGMPMAYVNAAGETLAKVGEKFYVTLPNGELKMENGAPKEDTIAGMKLVTDQPMPLDNIGNGSLKKNSKQAVNGGQLNDLLGSDIVDAEGNPLVTVSAALKKAATEVKAGTNSPISVTKSADAQDGHAIYTVDYDQNYLHGKIRTKALELASTGGNAATITSGIGNDGVTEVSFSSAPGADGTATPVRLQGIAPGIADNDAATVGQLRDANKGIKRRIDRIEDDLGGVAATAAALASLPQSYIPGKSVVAIGTGVYRSKQAVALGVSRISDNGKIILKINASHDTTGNTTFGAGAGFLF